MTVAVKRWIGSQVIYRAGRANRVEKGVFSVISAPHGSDIERPDPIRRGAPPPKRQIPARSFRTSSGMAAPQAGTPPRRLDGTAPGRARYPVAIQRGAISLNRSVVTQPSAYRLANP